MRKPTFNITLHSFPSQSAAFWPRRMSVRNQSLTDLITEADQACVRLVGTP